MWWSRSVSCSITLAFDSECSCSAILTSLQCSRLWFFREFFFFFFCIVSNFKIFSQRIWSFLRDIFHARNKFFSSQRFSSWGANFTSFRSTHGTFYSWIASKRLASQKCPFGDVWECTISPTFSRTSKQPQRKRSSLDISNNYDDLAAGKGSYRGPKVLQTGLQEHRGVTKMVTGPQGVTKGLQGPQGDTEGVREPQGVTERGYSGSRVLQRELQGELQGHQRVTGNPRC